MVTPHNSHYEYVKLALELGKPVLCEKSFTTDAGHAEELIRLAEEKGVYLAEAMWTWFSPVANKVSQWLSDGEFGEIHTVIAHYHFNSQGYAPRATDPNRAGGALLDVGVYPITYLYRLFGMPVEIKSCGVLKNGIDLYEDVALTFQNGKTFQKPLLRLGKLLQLCVSHTLLVIIIRFLQLFFRRIIFLFK